MFTYIPFQEIFISFNSFKSSFHRSLTVPSPLSIP